MSARRILIIHPDEDRRRELRELFSDSHVVEAASRQQAVALLADAQPALVVTHHDELRRLLRDLDRHAPSAVRAVLLPPGNEVLRQALVDIAAEGYDFVTVDERAPETMRALLYARCSARVRPLAPLVATFRVQDPSGLTHTAFTCDVAEVSSDGLGLDVDASAPVERLQPGVRLEEATVRRGTTLVLEPRSWLVRTVRATNGRSVNVGVELDAPRAADPPAERVDDPVTVRGLLRRAAFRKVAFEVRLADGARRCVFTGAALEPAIGLRQPMLVVSAPSGAQRFEAGEIVRVSFELGGQQHSAVVGVVAANALAVTLSLPRSVSRRQRRSSLRIQSAAEDRGELTITFRSPLTDALVTRPLLDLQASGAAFPFESDGEAFPPGLVLTDAVITLHGRRIACCATVQGTVPVEQGDPGAGLPSARRCGVRLWGLDDGGRQAILDALVSWLAPGVADGSEVPFDEVWELFEREEVHFPDYPHGDPDAEDVLASAQAKCGDGRHGLSKTLVYRDKGDLVGHSSGLRVYSKTWLSQHLVVRSGFHRGAHVSQALVNLTLHYGEALDDIEYLRGLWRTSNRWAARIYGAGTLKVVKPGLSYVVGFTPLRRAVSLGLLPPKLVARPAQREDFPALLAYLRRTEDPVRLWSNDLVEEELLLDSLSSRYARAGLARSRTVAVVDGPDGPLGWALMEDMTPGLFWAEWYNSFRLFVPLDPVGLVRHALVAFAYEDARRRGRPAAECLADDDDVALLEALGFTNLGPVMEFCTHRSMTREVTERMLTIFERLALRGARQAESEAPERVASVGLEAPL